MIIDFIQLQIVKDLQLNMYVLIHHKWFKTY